jgi:hypothetical protein
VIGVVTWIVPFASLVTAAIVPLAAGLYLLATTAWTLAERTVLRRRVLAASAGTGNSGPPPPAISTAVSEKDLPVIPVPRSLR